MKFIIQKLPYQDFINELYLSKDYWNWRDKSKEFIIFTDKNDISLKDIKNVCPVGSVEFVINWLSDIFNKVPKPINFPLDSQIKHNRRILNINLDKNYNLDKFNKVFMKSNDIIKYDKNGYYNLNNINNIKDIFISSKNIQVSEYLDNIISEWRVFIKNGRILDIKNYLGDPWLIPKKDIILSYVNQYYKTNDSPANTMDFMITDTGNCELLEVHDFFSCGLYGFSNYEKYPFMLYQWFKWFTNNL